MTTIPPPEQEKLRLERVAFMLTGSAAMASFLNKQTQLAATFAGVPVGLTTLLESEQSVVIGRAGWEIAALPLASSLSSAVVKSGETKIIRRKRHAVPTFVSNRTVRPETGNAATLKLNRELSIFIRRSALT